MMVAKTGDIGVQTFDTVDEVLFVPKFKCTVDGRRFGSFALFKNIIGADRFFTVDNNGQDKTARLGKTKSVLGAIIFGLYHNVVHKAVIARLFLLVSLFVIFSLL